MLDDIDENVLVFGYWNLCFCNWVLKFVYLYLSIFICVFVFVLVHYKIRAKKSCKSKRSDDGDVFRFPL